MKKQNNSRKHTYIIHAAGIAGIILLLLIRLSVKFAPGTHKSETSFSTYLPEKDTVSLTKKTVTATAPSDKKDILSVPDSTPSKKSTYKPYTPVKTELNTADSADLVMLYGIGPYYAQKILEYRQKLGGYAIPEQLLEIKGIDEERLKGFSHKIFADSTLIRKMDVKTAEESQLADHIYIGKYLARCIVLYREAAHPDSCSIAHLVRDGILTEEQGRRISWYLH
ncbi:MAG: helix-hairpin-helix domain-containing protein [Bacteroidales bacterium]|jgi:DNA uptake protein ComE-like DNA-binding protein